MAFFLAAVAVVAVAWWLSPGDEAVGKGTVGAQEAEPVQVEGGQPAEAQAAVTGRAEDPAATPDAGTPEPEPGMAGTSEPPPSSRPVVPRAVPIPRAGDAPLVAVVIDDLGRDVADVRRLAALDIPVTYAVLPFETRTPEVVAEVERVGGELLLHLPMEGRDGADPGPGALRAGMKPRELRRATRAAMTAVPGAVGVNNHMGSVLSADPRSMRAVLREISRDGVYFLDSRTTAESVAYPAARRLGLAAAERDVFLDGERTEAAVRDQFRRVLEVARDTGSGIAIGHPHEVTLAVLEEEVPAARAVGFEFVAVSALLDRAGLPE